MDQEILRKIGKVELHCHLDGSLSLSCIRQLAALENVELPQDDTNLKRLVSVPEQTESLLDYLKVFDVVLPLLQTKIALSLAAYDLVEQAAAENVLYIEVRFAPQLSTNKGLTIIEVIQAVLDGLERGSRQFGVMAKAIVCGLKQVPKETTMAVFKESVALAPKGLVAFDFAGNEADFPTSELEDIIKETQSLGLPLTFHAGECGCVNNVSEAVRLGIKRIGHGTALIQDDSVIKEIVDQNVTVEMCLTSNLQTKAAKSIEEFPYLKLNEAGVKLTINTDNRTVSDTNLTKEYALFVDYFGTSLEEFYQYNKYAIEANFASPNEKNILLERLVASYPF